VKKYSNNNRSVSNNKKGVSMKKSKLIINDLSFESSQLGFQDSFGMESTEFYSQTDYSVDSYDYLAGQAYEDHMIAQSSFALVIHEGMTAEEIEQEEAFVNAAQKKLKIYIEVARKAEGVELDGEVGDLIAAQRIDQNQARNTWLHSERDLVTVKVQRLSDSGNWYNVKYTKGEFKGEAIQFSFDADAIFNMNEANKPESLKENDLTTHLQAEMKKLGFDRAHLQFFTNEFGEKDSKIVPQRFTLSCKALFTDGVTINGKKIASVAAPFKYGFNKETKEVVSDFTYYAFDSLVELNDYVVVIPSDEDKTHGQVDSMEFDAGILTGRNVATSSMMRDEMEIDELKEMFKEENRLKAITMSFKKKEEFKKVAIAFNYKETLANHPDAHDFVIALVAESYTDDIFEKEAVMKKIKNFTNIDELDKVVTAYRAVHGKGLEYSIWKWLKECKKNVVRREAGKVDKSVAHNIGLLNKGDIKLEQLSDDQVVDMYAAALEFRKELPAYNINDKVRPALVVRACTITGTKAPADFLRVVRKVF
jgi:hypothetical protein